jgi:3-isopropylmalate/(R)-2-methylmalate dehydratase small subunit
MWHTGKAWFFGDDVDTDQIMPARYLALRTAEDLAKHVLEAVDPSWPKTIKPGDIVIAGANFGCGSSREHAPLGLKGAGVACVVAKSFARIFFRNAINIGLPLLIMKQDIADRTQGRPAWIDVENGSLKFSADGEPLRGTPPASIVRDILRAGGLMPYVATKAKPAA